MKFRYDGETYDEEGDGKNITCANCGLTMHVDQWLDEEVRQIRRSRS